MGTRDLCKTQHDMDFSLGFHLGWTRNVQNSIHALENSSNVWEIIIDPAFTGLVYLSHKSHNAPLPYPTAYPFVTEMRSCVHISGTKCCIVGYLSDALWDLFDCLMHPGIVRFVRFVRLVYWIWFTNDEWASVYLIAYAKFRMSQYIIWAGWIHYEVAISSLWY